MSHSFGYGLMDAAAMVRLAKRWRTVPEQHKCEVSAPHMGRLVNNNYCNNYETNKQKSNKRKKDLKLIMQLLILT